MSNNALIIMLGFYTLFIIGLISYYEEKLAKTKKQSDYWHDLVHTINDIDHKKNQEIIALRKDVTFWQKETFDSRETATKQWFEIKELKSLVALKTKPAKKAVKKVSRKQDKK